LFRVMTERLRVAGSGNAAWEFFTKAAAMAGQSRAGAADTIPSKSSG
jgi:hypothetical protein